MFRILSYSLKNILRNKFLSISSILVLGLLMFFVNLLMILNNLSNTLIESINSKLTISLYLKDEYAGKPSIVDDFINQLKIEIRDINLEYKTKDEVLEEVREQDEEFVKIIKDINPLPATINISGIKIDEYELLNEIISSKEFILSDIRDADSSFNYKNQYARIVQITNILSTLKYALYVIISIFLLSIFIITYSIIWNFIYHYRDEIYITKLVWWWSEFIYWPFVFQGIIYAVLGFLLSSWIFSLWVNNAWVFFKEQTIKAYIINDKLLNILLLQLGIFVLIWALSAYLSTKRYIKEN